MNMRALIREIPDFPSPGILFRDITPLLADPAGLTAVTDAFAERYGNMCIDKIVGIESRGFIFGAPLAMRLGVGFVPARKPGKLPYKTVEEAYSLEYGTNTICLHADSILQGQRVLVMDDVIATGGTLAATCRLIDRLGGTVVEAATLAELSALDGRKLLNGLPFFSLLQF